MYFYFYTVKVQLNRIKQIFYLWTIVCYEYYFIGLPYSVKTLHSQKLNMVFFNILAVVTFVKILDI